MAGVEDDAEIGDAATGWLLSDERQVWRPCNLRLLADRLTIDADDGPAIVAMFSGIRGVDEVDAPANGRMTIELSADGHPALRVACPDSLVTALVERLHQLDQRDPAPVSLGQGYDSLVDADPRTVVAAAVAAMSEHSANRRLGGRKALELEVERLRAALAAMGVQERLELALQIEATREEIIALRASVEEEIDAQRARVAEELSERQQRAEARLSVVKGQIGRLQRAADAARSAAVREEAALVKVRDEAMLQEVGIYAYRLPLEDSSAYAARLESVRTRIAAMGKPGSGAITATSDWTVNDSVSQGRKMVEDLSKLMLRAYNAEAERLAQTMLPFKLDAATERLSSARDAIGRLGRTMSITVSPAYHQLRIEELSLIADYLAKSQEEKDAEQAAQLRLRDEAAARRDAEAEKSRLLEEQAHHQRSLVAVQRSGDAVAATAVEAKLAEIDEAIVSIDKRTANHRAGHVYVVSNIGSFGERMVKIGTTRRLDPMDRIGELGDDSVPFRYDVHALVFSEDAVELEQKLRRALADQQVNLVDPRRGFFYATPEQAKELLEQLEGARLSFVEHPEAEEWRMSENTRRRSGD